MKYIVTDLGPLDRLPPGTDVTGRYRAEVLDRLIADGYVEEAPTGPRQWITVEEAAELDAVAAELADEDEVTDGD